MSKEISRTSADEPGKDHNASQERLVYVMPQDAIRRIAENQLTLVDLWKILWRRKFFIIFVTTLFAIGSVAYALSATEWYRAEVLLAPADKRTAPSLTDALGGLASLAGIGGGATDTVEALAVLRSREFSGAFIEDNNLLPVIYGDLAEAADSSEAPDLRDAVRYFEDNVRTVSEDRRSGIVTLSIEWKDPDMAADWANQMVRRLNDQMRDEALKEAEKNIAYLEGELGQTSVYTLQQSIGRLLEGELQQLMLARGNDEFAFKVVDPAQAPKIRSRPRRSLLAVVGTLFGGALAVIIVLISNAITTSRKSAEPRSGA